MTTHSPSPAVAVATTSRDATLLEPTTFPPDEYPDPEQTPDDLGLTAPTEAEP
ncbi:hypothetical protein [Cellulomonas soli]|uniref:Uncharacterized protein n=1 Tax=Cellulomonas soli TaxID=931535 RepID=A0A512PB45_9CELL|nr:hypothetical protein [Cellulomonas soli]NYI57388.1 hypothetical protein [Cellulomonas soli]GEP68332.1 hypothetical protein CSO01_10470 [Cellulomonas soli]